MTDIDEQNIAEIINLKEFSKPMIDPPSLEKDILDNDNNRQNFLILVDRVINKEFSLIEVALIDSSVDMNYIQEGLITLKSYERFTFVMMVYVLML